MGIPSGEIVARPMVARACGCLQEFQEFRVDRYRAQRLAKFKQSRCSACVTKLNEEQKLAAAALPKKGEAFQLLPVGTEVSIKRNPDGSWAGSLSGGGTTVEAVSDGIQGLIVTLARNWAAKVTPKPAATPQPAAPAKPGVPSPK
jgi:hypothetical protein